MLHFAYPQKISGASTASWGNVVKAYYIFVDVVGSPLESFEGRAKVFCASERLARGKPGVCELKFLRVGI